jgi:hypothetical protein
MKNVLFIYAAFVPNNFHNQNENKFKMYQIKIVVNKSDLINYNQVI